MRLFIFLLILINILLIIQIKDQFIPIIWLFYSKIRFKFIQLLTRILILEIHNKSNKANKANEERGLAEIVE